MADEPGCELIVVVGGPPPSVEEARSRLAHLDGVGEAVPRRRQLGGDDVVEVRIRLLFPLGRALAVFSALRRADPLDSGESRCTVTVRLDDVTLHDGPARELDSAQATLDLVSALRKAGKLPGQTSGGDARGEHPRRGASGKIVR